MGTSISRTASLIGGPPVEVIVITGRVAPPAALSVTENAELLAELEMRRPVVAGAAASMLTVGTVIVSVPKVTPTFAVVIGGPPLPVTDTTGTVEPAPVESTSVTE
jgi:hypothetical protein